MQRLQVGNKICAGRFEIQSPLGFGGSGEVYLGRDLRSEGQPLVALKIYSEILSGDSLIIEFSTRIQREATALAKISSDTIVKKLEIVSDSEMTILVQEYLSGGSLKEAIRNNPQKFAKPDVWLRAAIALAEGLESVHNAGLIHGDIKPANIAFRDADHQRIVYHAFAQAALINSRDCDRPPAVSGGESYSFTGKDTQRSCNTTERLG